MYFDEDLLLELRLNSLDKFVKKFVITEATYTHNGNKKELNEFNELIDCVITTWNYMHGSYGKRKLDRILRKN